MSETTSYDNLIAGTQKPLVTEPGTVKAGESFSRGALLGRVTATDQWQVTDKADAGSCNQFAIAAEAVDTTAGATALTSLYVEGEFAESAVIFGYSDTANDWRDTLEAQGIYLRKTISVAGQ